MSIRKRDFLRLGGSAAVALVAAASPATLNLGGFLPVLAVERAQAKDGNNGNGNGGGNGNGNGGGNGNSGGNGNGGGNGNSNGGGNSNSNGSGNGNSNGGSSTGSTGSSSSSSGASVGSGTRATAASDGSIDVRHSNGITEVLQRGRYIMKDSKGRTIINRQATASDARRLSRFLR
ncbi:hypothetical protein [Rhizobium leguminosarum]|uniref:Glycine-rich cell wall protein n=1 Tax=Rhizobium leguminosarum bv. viciae TaxID=387 RepID=A0A7G6RJ11_RHILV|nr:hypothetical protein [Rhizobium leguminosarum]MBP2487092.1 hypothetical protein [Rhizobium leguminosarum]QND42243.1 hypothetical protein HB770_09870 [Rhizobium leguminosarum bv. viciae]